VSLRNGGCSQESSFFFWHPLLTTNEVHAFLTLTVAKLNKKKILIELSHKLKRDFFNIDSMISIFVTILISGELRAFVGRVLLG